MYQFKRLSTPNQFDTYTNNFLESLGTENISKTDLMTLEYFNRSEAYGVFDSNDNMVAGYALGLMPPYRLPHFVPNLKDIDTPHETFNWDQCGEIVCVWKKKDAVSQKFILRDFWPHIFSSFLKTDKLYVLGHDQNASLDKHYSIFGPVTLYKGPSTKNLPSRLFIYTRGKIRCLKFFSYLKSIFKL